MADTITLENLYERAVQRLDDAGIKSARLDARLILMKSLNISHTNFITEIKVLSFSAVNLRVAQENLDKRCEGMPVSRIFNEREFWGLPFYINEHCLDPRPDTETLIEAVVTAFASKRREALRFVDFGVGSGCILLSLLREFPNAYGVAVDISYEALKVTQKNADLLGVADRINFVCSDWDSALRVRGEDQFDVVVSNPPYIESQMIPKLEREVIHFDPMLALDGGISGLNPYKILVPKLKFLLKSSGRAFFEIGKGQESDVQRLVEKTDATLNGLYRDIAGIIRVVDISCGDK
ncbi:MAG: peptide chain release factor N(5)-glutamine methyltransferase [Alphaproteobacteria bacterium]|nr:peptide chain release factor N(5)-glutamine methyltransferase [Alphaproteobacteria bacterium]